MDEHLERQIARLRTALRPLESHSRQLPWADEFPGGTPWRPEERVQSELRVYKGSGRRSSSEIVKVDLHNLDRRGAEMAARKIRRQIEDGASPVSYVRIIVGKGNNSKDGKRVLADAVEDLLPERSGRLQITNRTEGAPDGYYDVYNPEKFTLEDERPAGAGRRQPARRGDAKRSPSGPREKDPLLLYKIAGAVVGTLALPVVGTIVGWFIGGAIGKHMEG